MLWMTLCWGRVSSKATIKEKKSKFKAIKTIKWGSIKPLSQGNRSLLWTQKHPRNYHKFLTGVKLQKSTTMGLLQRSPLKNTLMKSKPISWPRWNLKRWNYRQKLKIKIRGMKRCCQNLLTNEESGPKNTKFLRGFCLTYFQSFHQLWCFKKPKRNQISLITSSTIARKGHLKTKNLCLITSRISVMCLKRKIAKRCLRN